MDREKWYLFKRIAKGKAQSILFYMFRVLPVNRKKIVFCCIEGTTGYSCNPKYIAEELLRQRAERKTQDGRNMTEIVGKNTGQGDSNRVEKDYELVWLVNDLSKQFPQGIKKVKNTLWNRAYQLTTAKIWIDNSRKQLEVRKRKGQIYIQTWHAKLGFKPTCLDRGASFSEIAYLVSKHDSDMVDYWLSNSDWYDHTLKTGSLYEGNALRVGSPRCDILVNGQEEQRRKIREHYHIPQDAKIMMYAPTFRGGSQGTNRQIQEGGRTLNLKSVIDSLESRFDGKWFIMLRLHPQLVARGLDEKTDNTLREKMRDRIIDISRADDMYEILAGCDAFMTDYSSAAFDAAVMKMPIFLYCDDYKEYQAERGRLLWNLEELPFDLAQNPEMLDQAIQKFDQEQYKKALQRLFDDTGMAEDGKASRRVVELLKNAI